MSDKIRKKRSDTSSVTVELPISGHPERPRQAFAISRRALAPVLIPRSAKTAANAVRLMWGDFLNPKKITSDVM